MALTGTGPGSPASLPAGPALIRLTAAVGERIMAARARSGLGAHQIQVLRSAAARNDVGGVPMSELASQMALSRSTVTSLVDQVIAAGLAERTVDVHDKRILRVRPTPAGLDLLRGFDADVGVLVETLVHDMPPEQCERLADLLARLSLADVPAYEETSDEQTTGSPQRLVGMPDPAAAAESGQGD